MTDPTPPPERGASTTLTDAARATLVRVLRVTYPHDRFPDGPYQRTADTVIAAAAESPWLQTVLAEGLRSLDGLAGGSFTDLDEAAATTALRHVEHTPFFRLVRSTAIVSLYDDHEVWELLGYEGPSFDQGGYVDRGFDDLDWLPEPRIEEYDGPVAFEPLAPAPPFGRGEGARS